MEVLADVLVEIRLLLVRQLDVQADARRLAFVGAFVGRFHDAGAAAGDHGEAGVGEKPRGLLGECVVRMAGHHARAAEEAHGGPYRRELVGRLHEL